MEEKNLRDRIIFLWEEHLFWLEILQDHAYFVRDHLPTVEREYVNTAQQYINLFGGLITMLKNIPHSITYTDEASIQFAKRSWPIAKGYYEFEGRMHALRIDNQVNLNLSPTYLNGTLAGNQEYLRILGYLIQGDEGCYPFL